MTADVTSPRRTGTRAENLALAVLRTAGCMAVAALVAFHAWLLWSHVVQGRALEPQTAVRWLAAALVLAAFRSLSRHGLPLLWGRRAIVLWLLVILIHCHATWTGDVAGFQIGIPETIHALAQLAEPAVVLGLILFSLLTAAAAWSPGRRVEHVRPARIAGLPSSGYLFARSPRPPPAA